MPASSNTSLLEALAGKKLIETAKSGEVVEGPDGWVKKP